MATAEIAVALPALLALLAFALTVVTVIGGQLRCVDAAREASRALARGEPLASVRSLAAQAGPAGAAVTTSSRGDRVSAAVRARIRPFGHVLPAFSVHAEAIALREPTAGAEP